MGEVSIDKPTAEIAQFAAELEFAELKQSSIDAARRVVIDAVGCLLGGYSSAEARNARQACPTVSGPGRGRIVGGKRRTTTTDAAAFANTVALRYLDFNDRFPGLHPSDCLGALMSVAEAWDATGADLITATVVSYEIANRLTQASGVRLKGVDQGWALGIATAAGVSKLRRLSVDETAHAVSIMGVSHVPLRVVRNGTLSPWKAAATAHACRNAVTIVDLVANGMRGPEAPFAGPEGLFDRFGNFDVGALGAARKSLSIDQVDMKYWPACYRLQSSIFAGQELRTLVDWREIASITVRTHATAATGTDAEKYDPRTRETADHSIPYVLARSLVDGRVDLEHFDQTAYLDPALRPLMAKMRVVEDPEIEAVYPDDLLVRLDITLDDGSQRSVEVVNPKGHMKNPLGDSDVEAKFLALSEPVLGRERSVEFHGALANLATASRLESLFELASIA